MGSAACSEPHASPMDAPHASRPCAPSSLKGLTGDLEFPACSGSEDATGLWEASLDALYSVGE